MTYGAPMDKNARGPTLDLTQTLDALCLQHLTPMLVPPSKLWGSPAASFWRARQSMRGVAASSSKQEGG